MIMDVHRNQYRSVRYSKLCAASDCPTGIIIDWTVEFVVNGCSMSFLVTPVVTPPVYELIQ